MEWNLNKMTLDEIVKEMSLLRKSAIRADLLRIKLLEKEALARVAYIVEEARTNDDASVSGIDDDLLS